MKNQFDRIFAEKIKYELLNRTESYQSGAWENFQPKKNEKRSEILLWYFSGIAASILIVFSIGFLLIEGTAIHNKPTDQVLQIEKKNLSEIQPEQAVCNTASLTENTNQIEICTDSLKVSNDLLLNEEFLVSRKLTKKAGKRIATNMIRDGVSLDDFLQVNAYERMVYDSIFLVDKIEKSKANMPSINISDDLSVEDNMLVSSDSITQDNIPAIVTNDIATLSKEKERISIGFLFSPGYGANEENNQSITGSNLGGGISLDIPLKTSQFSVNTGLIFNSLNISNEEILVLATETNVRNFVTNQLNIDIPINLSYTIPNKKENFFVMAGMSSYFAFKENIELTTTTTRDVKVFMESGGNIEEITVTESSVNSDSFEGEPNRFYPMGMINISVGYKASISGYMIYEIQPFYKYPLSGLTNDHQRLPIAGINLKITFTNKK